MFNGSHSTGPGWGEHYSLEKRIKALEKKVRDLINPPTKPTPIPSTIEPRTRMD